MSRRYATLSSSIPAIGRGQESLHAIFSGNPNICSGCRIRCYAGRRPLRRPRRATAHRESIRPTWSPASSDQRQHDHPAGVHGRPGTQWHRLGGSLKIVDGTEPRLAATPTGWSGPPAEVPSDPRPRRRRGTCVSCSALGPPRRARPRLVRVRLADNLRSAPGGPADPNGTSGSPPPGDRWINGLPPGRRRLGAEGERAARVGCLPPPIPPVRESLMRVGGAPAGVIHSLPQWSSGRVAQSGLEGGIVRSLRHRGVAQARLARDECPADARTQSPPGAG
jgi:hypothetical protein